MKKHSQLLAKRAYPARAVQRPAAEPDPLPPEAIASAHGERACKLRIRVLAMGACALLCSACVLLCSAGAVLAQGPGNGPDNGPPQQGDNNGPGGQNGPGGGQGGPGGRHGRPPLPPIIHALDTNHDGIIEADEISNAAASLRTLEKSGSDQLTIPELLGPRPPWMRHHQRGGNNNPETSGTQGGDQNGPPPPPPPGGDDQQNQQQPPGPPPGGPGDDQNGPPSGPPPTDSGTDSQSGPSSLPQGGQGQHHHHHRLPPVIEALDTNHDGIIESSEIDNAPAALKTLDKDGAGQLTIPELLGPPPPRPGGEGGGQGQNGPGGDNGPGGGGGPPQGQPQ
jgi:hypothetical protein